MKNLKLSLILVLVLILMISVLAAEAKNQQVYNWKMISGETEGMGATVFCRAFAEEVEKRSDGRIKIEVFPYGTLGVTRDILELNQMGEIELCAIDTSWLASFIPEMSVFNLQYIWPKRDNIEQIIYEVVKNGKAIQLLQKACREKNFQLLSLYSAGWMEISSNVPILTPEDCQGLKHRVWGNPVLVQAYNAFGFNSQSLNWTEVYSALETHIIDSQYQAMPGHWDYSLYEVQSHITNIWNEIFMMSPTINSEVFDSLPEDLQKIIVETALDLTKVDGDVTKWNRQNRKDALENIKKNKPSMKFYQLSDEEVTPFKELVRQDKGALKVYEKVAGDKAKVIYDALLNDIELAQNK